MRLFSRVASFVDPVLARPWPPIQGHDTMTSDHPTSRTPGAILPNLDHQVRSEPIRHAHAFR
ncbi:hypothetical protein [Tautonia rosea]|uniref:hypothetical protein n=1 Tax=Tautonia rosea TaxID=2728037 RepID=UPI0014730E8F|nr:hypothetical protein [Tautonia rosea]